LFSSDRFRPAPNPKVQAPPILHMHPIQCVGRIQVSYCLIQSHFESAAAVMMLFLLWARAGWVGSFLLRFCVCVQHWFQKIDVLCVYGQYVSFKVWKCSCARPWFYFALLKAPTHTEGRQPRPATVTVVNPATGSDGDPAISLRLAVGVPFQTSCCLNENRNRWPSEVATTHAI
jgi:hypothetical protein